MVRLDKISFSYDDSQALIKDFSLDVKKGEFVTLLGPSGCGKTTILRLIAGFIAPSSGSILIDGVDQAAVPVNKRGVGIVFQNYALFPHLNVLKNISYPLLSVKDPQLREERRAMVAYVIETLGLGGLLDRYPSQLSGGQQQRTALARSLVQCPKVLLMDEPLSSLDLKLRENIREELKALQKKMKITTVYVTHDREEAFFLSDRIAVVNQGVIEQFDAPQTLYFSPENDFVSNFAGKINTITLSGKDYIVRPEWLRVLPKDDKSPSSISAQVSSIQFLGSTTRLLLKLQDGKMISADIPSLDARAVSMGERVSLVLLHKVEKKPEVC